MKTAYKPSIISPYQTMQKKTFDTRDKKHPAREEIERCVGTYNLTAVIEEDIQTQAIMRHVPGLISFLCTPIERWTSNRSRIWQFHLEFDQQIFSKSRFFRFQQLFSLMPKLEPPKFWTHFETRINRLFLPPLMKLTKQKTKTSLCLSRKSKKVICIANSNKCHR